MAATNTYSSITERQEEHGGHHHELDSAGCGCFRRFCFGWDDEGPSSHNYLLRETGSAVHHQESWVVEKFKKLRGFSEMVAGPKWKNLVRRIGRFCNPKKSNKETTDQQFQYSPQSYALNFAGGEEEEEDGQLLHSFSTRFAPHASTYNDQHTRFGL